jgi:BlaI family penicillinase repressor
MKNVQICCISFVPGGPDMTTLDAHDLEIMKVLWERGSLKPAEIQAELSSPVKNSALRWRLESLRERGHVTRRKRGKAYFYEATTPRQNVLNKLVRRMADIFCKGSAFALIGQMIESEQLSAEDVRELQEYAGKKVLATKRAGTSAGGRK